MPTAAPDRRPFRLGFLTHVHGEGRDAGSVYRELLQLFEAADELGFDGGWVAQHHFRDDFGRLPSPLVLLAAAAQRTRRLRLGTAVTTLPLENPLRLAEDAAVLDALSGGRLELGLGTAGANHEAFAAFGRDVEQRRPLFDDHLATLRTALRGELLAGDGVDEHGRPLTLQPPVPGLAHRLWQSSSEPARAAAAARAGDGLLLGTAVHDPRTEQRPLAEAYRLAWAEAHHPDEARPPRIAVVRAVFPAVDRRTAQEDLAPALAVHREAFIKHGYTDLSRLSTEDYLRRINVHHGHPDEVIASLAADPALLDYTRGGWFLPVVQHERSTLEQDLWRLETIATEIAPALGWRPAPHRTGAIA